MYCAPKPYIYIHTQSTLSDQLPKILFYGLKEEPVQGNILFHLGLGKNYENVEKIMVKL